MTNQQRKECCQKCNAIVERTTTASSAIIKNQECANPLCDCHQENNTLLNTFKEEAMREFKHFQLIDGSNWLSEDPDTIEKLESFLLSQITTAHALGRKEALEEITHQKLNEKSQEHKNQFSVHAWLMILFTLTVIGALLYFSSQ